MKRVLLTGASGFVGANLARRLLQDGHEVHLLLRPGHQPWRLESIRDEIVEHGADLADAEAVGEAVAAARPEWVFHLAAHGAYPWQGDDRRIVETNVVGAANLVRACLQAGFEAFVNAGSSSEYGFKDHAPAESELPEPNSHYAVAKASATLLCRYAAREHGVRIVTLRLYSVYGPFEEPARLVPTLLVRGLDGELPPLADPRVARDFVHVDDVCEAFVRAAARDGQETGAVYNVGSGAQTTLREVVDLVRRILPIPAEPAWGSMANRTWDSFAWLADPRKIRDALGWTATVPLAEGLARTAGWLRGDPERLRFYRGRLA